MLALLYSAVVPTHLVTAHLSDQCRYFTANGTSTTGTLPLGIIQAAIAQAKANPYDTFTISFGAGPSLPQGEVRPASRLHAILTLSDAVGSCFHQAPADRPVSKHRSLEPVIQTDSHCALCLAHVVQFAGC